MDTARHFVDSGHAAVACPPPGAELQAEVQRLQDELARERAAAADGRTAFVANLRQLTERTRGLLDEQTRLSQRGRALLDMTRRLVEEPGRDGMLRLGLETAARQFADAEVLGARCQPGSGRFSLEATAVRSSGLAAFLRGVASPASFGAELLASRCATSGLLDDRYPFDAALVRAGMKAVLAMPIVLDVRPAGVVIAAWPEPHECPPEDLWFLENLAAQLALALRSADLRSRLCRFRSSSARR